MSKEYMQAFREARKLMGFTHTSAYVPNNRLTEHSLYVDRITAERMLEICQLLPTSRERISLSKRNVKDVPSPDEVKRLAGNHPNQASIQRQAKECIEALEKANSTMNVAKLAEDEEDQVKWASMAVAWNHMASVLWKELTYATMQVKHE